MLDFLLSSDSKTMTPLLETNLSGKALLAVPQLNKGTAFTEEERRLLRLEGKLPLKIETLEEQVARCRIQYDGYETALQKRHYLMNLHSTNQVLFYALVSQYLEEMIPILYTPFVGSAIKSFSTEFRQPRGLYLSYPQRHRIREILSNRTHPEVQLIVMTDGERVLGLGDQGIGGMDIPIAKLMVYTLCGGIHPLKTLPLLLDVGTNNAELLGDPHYLGWRHERLSGEEYDAFITEVVSAIQEAFPSVFLHWEDFGRENARRHLERYQNQICTFNDDMQGTAAVTVAALLAAIDATQVPLHQQRIVIFGGGTAGTGIADQIQEALERSGLPKHEAREKIYLVDRPGLLFASMRGLTPYQTPYARSDAETELFGKSPGTFISLYDVVHTIHPTVLIGCSSVVGAFSEELIVELAKHVAQPIIFPLSNPTECCEAQPADLLRWTQGRALIATGSPFPPVQLNGVQYQVAQCNNALVFPGIGLGILASKARRLSDPMLWAACQTLSHLAPVRQKPTEGLLPKLSSARSIAQAVALAVGLSAMEEGLAPPKDPEVLKQDIADLMWTPHYIPIRPKI